jgi:hypothetical protein
MQQTKTEKKILVSSLIFFNNIKFTFPIFVKKKKNIYKKKKLINFLKIKILINLLINNKKIKYAIRIIQP